jgi:hypothetical protein
MKLFRDQDDKWCKQIGISYAHQIIMDSGEKISYFVVVNNDFFCFIDFIRIMDFTTNQFY